MRYFTSSHEICASRRPLPYSTGLVLYRYMTHTILYRTENILFRTVRLCIRKMCDEKFHFRKVILISQMVPKLRNTYFSSLVLDPARLPSTSTDSPTTMPLFNHVTLPYGAQPAMLPSLTLFNKSRCTSACLLGSRIWGDVGVMGDAFRHMRW